MQDKCTSDLQKELLPLDFDGLNEHLEKRLREELNETEEIKERSLKELRYLLKQSESIIYPNDDAILVQYLRGRKYDVKEAAAMLKSLYDLIRQYAEIYQDFDFQSVVKTLDENFLGYLPYRDQDGSAILVVKVGKWNPAIVSMADLLRTLSASALLELHKPATQVAGFKAIFDFKGISFRHLVQLSPRYIFLLIEALKGRIPGRFRAIHMVNENRIFMHIWTLVKTFCSKKIQERFTLHGRNPENVSQYISPAALPKEYGGYLCPFDNSEWAEKVKRSETQATEMYNYGYRL